MGLAFGIFSECHSESAFWQRDPHSNEHTGEHASERGNVFIYIIRAAHRFSKGTHSRGTGKHASEHHG
jgi:hypothetical protein